MSEEEKKAIEKFRTKIKRADEDILKFSDVYTTLDIHNLRILLNLIEKQQKELEKKDKIIDLMAEQLTTDYHNKKNVKEYFTKKAEGEKE